MTRGVFITIEGSEGAGKSTMIEFIHSYLVERHKDVVVTREPGGTFVAEEIRNILLRPPTSEMIQPETELLLMFAGRAQHLNTCILPALKTGQWVLSDRFIDASYAYQGGGRGINDYHIKALDRLVVGNLYPDLTILLDVSADIGLQRVQKRIWVQDRIEQEKIDFFIRVREAYLNRAKQDPKRIKIVDANTTVENVQSQIKTHLDQFLAKE